MQGRITKPGIYLLDKLPAEDSGRNAPTTLYITYDNMCNLDRLLVAKKPLPLPAPFYDIWGSVQKIIDTFHLLNHKEANTIKTR